MRILLSAILVLFLGGCAGMMIGGANSGGYKPPADQCTDENDGENCRT